MADVKGLNKIYADAIIAESGDINYFRNRDQYYNFTGLVPRFAQSGKFQSKFNHVNWFQNNLIMFINQKHVEGIYETKSKERPRNGKGAKTHR